MDKDLEKYAVTEAHISLDNLLYNYNQIKKRVDPCQVMAVVKADAYGHGAISVAKTLVEEGVKIFAVARLSEALELRAHAINKKILIFGRLFPEEVETAIRNDFRITLTCQQDIELIAKKAKQLDKKAQIHINVDTGMGRAGILTDQAFPVILQTLDNPNLKVEGLYSHFSTADTTDKPYANSQLKKFQKILSQLEKHQIEIPYIHMANGGAMLDIPESYSEKFNMVRAGIILYGYYPSLETSESIPLRQVMTLKTRVLELREMPANYSISYGRRYTTERKTTVAVLPTGYADGILRSFTNQVKVMIKGELYPIIGTVTMDQIMVAVDENVKEGDEVIFWGESDQGFLPASQVADQAGTISYELTCSVSPRVARIYDQE
ncbi:MAG TPA: alanine racemase [bacterium]|nr:alanine racemase [bacterium]